MADEVFISYSRRDLEFVTRLASDLDARVAGVLFDKSDIQAGWLSVKNIPRLEPGITGHEAGWVTFGWGPASLMGTQAGLESMGAIESVLGM